MREIESGEFLSPTIYSTSPGIDGTPASWPYTQFVLTPEDADPVLDRQISDGYTVLKIYQNLRLDTYNAVVEAARRKNLLFGGHVPHRVGLFRVLEARQYSIEHFSGYEAVLNPHGSRGYPAWISIDASKISPAAIVKRLRPPKGASSRGSM